jgi:16S rRNA (adenine1518-N6/adenine1519-N6)-dimethyltransferase
LVLGPSAFRRPKPTESLFRGRRGLVCYTCGSMARRRLGQHFLGDPGWRKRIADTLPLRPGDTWVEIGPGHGEMTELLARDGRRVVAIETDAHLADELRRRAITESSGPAGSLSGLEVVSADVLQVYLGKLAPKSPDGKFRVYGNLPYYITSPILHHLFRWADWIASIHIVIQLEVAERIVAQPNRREYGYLSVLSQFYTKPEIMLKIPGGAFRPPPKVTSALVKMTLPGDRGSLAVADELAFLDFVQRCFSQKRKILRNNLRGLTSESQIRDALAGTGLRADARAEQLPLPHFAQLFSILRENRNAGQELEDAKER